MNPSKTTYIIVSALILTLLPASAAEPAPGQQAPKPAQEKRPARPHFEPEPGSFKTVTYKKIGKQELEMDIFPARPEVKNAPAILLFHGGGWGSGIRDHMYQTCDYFAKRGMVGISAGYRFRSVKPNPFPDKNSRAVCVADAASAIRWVKSHAAELGIDPNKLVIGGASAGGHIATMTQVASEIHNPDDDMSISPKAAAMVLFNPAYQTEAFIWPNLKSDDLSLEPGPLASGDVPPMIMFFGTNDKFLPNGESFMRDCVSKGATGELWLASRQPHGFWRKMDYNFAACLKADAFLTKLGILSPPPEPLPEPKIKFSLDTMAPEIPEAPSDKTQTTQ